MLDSAHERPLLEPLNPNPYSSLIDTAEIPNQFRTVEKMYHSAEYQSFRGITHDLKGPATLISNYQIIVCSLIPKPDQVDPQNSDLLEYVNTNFQVLNLSKNVNDLIKKPLLNTSTKQVSSENVDGAEVIINTEAAVDNTIGLIIATPYTEEKFNQFASYLLSLRQKIDPGVDIQQLVNEYHAAISDIPSEHKLQGLYLSEISHYQQLISTQIEHLSGLRSHADANLFGKLGEEFNSAIAPVSKYLDTVARGNISLAEITARCQDIISLYDYVPKSQKFDLVDLIKSKLSPEQLVRTPLALPNLEKMGSIPIDTDPNIVSTVVDCFLDNANKYGQLFDPITNSYSSQPFEINVKKGTKYVYISVTDHGAGIRSKEVDRMNQIIAPGRNPDTAKIYEGTGYQLFAAKLLAEKIGAKIKVASSGLNQGSTFTLVLPRK